MIYKKHGWVSYEDWLGVGRKTRRSARREDYRPFNDARSFARQLTLKSSGQWFDYCKGLLPEKGLLPTDIPANPEKIYRRHGWLNWADWLGVKTRKERIPRYRPFKLAREFARSLNLMSIAEWRAFCEGKLVGKERRPIDIPTRPEAIYEYKGWSGFPDFLGYRLVKTKDLAQPTPNLSNRSPETAYKTYEESRAFALKLGLTSREEWHRCVRGELQKKKLPNDIPKIPNRHYGKLGVWKGWSHFLGCKPEPPSYFDARIFARSLELKSVKEWELFCIGSLPEKGTLPPDVPRHPDVYFRQEWKNWSHWLGFAKPKVRPYLPFRLARIEARKLGLKSEAEWDRFVKEAHRKKSIFPSRMPRRPQIRYADEGWVGWHDFLGVPVSDFRSFERARDFVWRLGLRTKSEWEQYCLGLLVQKGRLPEDIPSAPWDYYKGSGWTNVEDWLGVRKIFKATASKRGGKRRSNR